MTQPSLIEVGNFIIMVATGALIPTLLVVYKSRCKKCCWGCIEREVINTDDDAPAPPREAKKEIKLDVKGNNNKKP